MNSSYVHLHLHTHYSVLDGVCQVEPLIARAKELDMKAMAVTDHGAMYGAIDFYKTAEKNGIKPIIGFEAYVAPGSRHERSAHGMKDAAFHLTLLCTDTEGYLNLCRLCTIGYLEGYYYRPRVDKEVLREHGAGLIAMSGCLSGEVSTHLLNGREEEAEAAAREYREIFGENNFYLEAQDNGLPEQQRIIEPIAALSEKTGIPAVATSDVHYILPGHAKVQEVMICINTGKRLDDPNRMKMESDQFYLRSAQEMRLTFKGREDWCDRTVEIAERCNFDLRELHRDEHGVEQKFHLPRIASEKGESPDELMHKLCLEGLKARYGEPLPAEVTERYEREHKVIVEMGFPSYFLMVGEIVRHAKENGIWVGPGRGSAAGSIVAYALSITDIDPLKYDLLFERFLNEGRNEMPDIDIDFDKERRQEVVDYIVERFGREQCAQIVTFGRISAKSAVRDVGRVVGMPLHEVDTIAKMIPDMLKGKGGKSSIEIAMEQNPDLKEIHDKDPQVGELLDMAGELDGVIRQTGIHAAGVLVADRPLKDHYGPLAKRGEDITFQYDMKKVEVLGLCKVDVLGLETLTLLRKAQEIIRRSTGEAIDVNNVPLDDPATYAMLGKGDAKGVFQFESEGFRNLLARLKPDRFEDLIAAVAMFRPGPMQFIDPYVARKQGREEVAYQHPLLESILAETYGLVIYQEQVQAIAQQLAHFSLSEGDLMRRAMGKKIAAIMQEYKQKFIKQAHDTVGEKIAEDVFDAVEKFAAYGFNKSHSACYALIAYRTAYLKCHYPCEYMAALLSTNRGDTKKVVQYIDDARRMGIKVLPPDVNESGAYFTVSEGNIRFGLSAVKGVGDKAVESLEEQRTANGPFTSLHDFCERADLHLLNKGSVEALIKAGAFDSLGAHRAQFMAGLEAAIGAGSAAQRARNAGQPSLFGEVEDDPGEQLPGVPEWPLPEMLQREKEVLGFYVSAHPLSEHRDAIRTFSNADTDRLQRMNDGAPVVIGGLIADVQLRLDKKERRYARLVLEDLDGAVNAVVFNSVFEECKELLKEDRIVFFCGRLDRSREEPSLLVDEVVPLELAEEKLAGSAVISVDANVGDEQIEALKDLLRAHHGDKELYLRIRTPRRQVVEVRAGRKYGIKPSPMLLGEIERLFGEGHLYFRPRTPTADNGRKRGSGRFRSGRKTASA